MALTTVLRGHIHGFDNYFQAAPLGVDQIDRVSSEHQLLHLSVPFLIDGWKDGNDIKEDNVRWVFDQLAFYFHCVLDSRESHGLWVLLLFYYLLWRLHFFGCSRTGWPFQLNVTDESTKAKESYSYTPRSNFHISIDRLVRLMVEVQSDKYQSDRYRMLLQGACVARLGYNFFGPPFIVVALYIEKSGSVQRYFLFQRDKDDTTVCTFQSKQCCVFSFVLVGFLCLGHPKLEATIRTF